MKLTAIIFMVCVLGVAFATPYVMKRIQSGDSGVSLMQYTPPASSAQTRQTFYKWQDANGRWHFGNEAPEGVEAISVNIDTAANILAPVATQEEKSTDAQLISPEPAIPDSSVVMPSQALELIDQAKQVKSMLESRYSSENEP